MTKVTVVDLTKLNDDEKHDMALMALAMYLGEGCKYCPKTFDTLEQLKDAVWAGYHDRGRLAHRECWKQHHSPSN